MKTLLEVKSECLKPCAMAFHANMKRTQDFALFPAGIAFANRRDICFLINAIYRVTGKADLTLGQLVSAIDDETAKAIGEEIVQQNVEWARQPKITRDSQLHSHGMQVIEGYGKLDPNTSSSLDALMTSIVLESWLFFEAFAGDLWAAGVDNGGREISARIHANQQWEKSEMLASGVSVEIEANAKTHPGSFKREIGMVSFQKLRSIKTYYKIAFGEGAEKVFDQTSGGYIFALAAFRNCLTHSAGKIDKSFKKAVERFPEFNSLKIGNSILLDGELVKKLRNAAAETGLALLGFVDVLLAKDNQGCLT